VCGIDISKAGMVATIRVPSDGNPARRASETRSFATTRRGAGDGGLAAVLAGSRRRTGGHVHLLDGAFFRLEAEG